MKKKTFLVLLIILSIIPLLDLFHPNLPITHDGIDHVTRIANFYENLREGNMIPRWAGNLNWGYGHPILMFLYPLPSYLASFFHALNVNLVDSVKMVNGLGMALSAIFMFFWVSEMYGPLLGFLGGILYMVTPYRFIEVYVRGDIGENLAFAFVPLILFFMLKAAKEGKSYQKMGIALSMALLILSHNAISLMFLPFIMFYAWYLGRSDKKKLITLLMHLLLGFGLSAFFWIPGLMEGKYTLRNIVTKGAYLQSFIDPKALFYGPWSYGGTGQFSIQLGIVNWIGAISSILALLLVKKARKGALFAIPLLAFGTGSIFLMLHQSNFLWQKITLLSNFQFPWRFLAVLVFVTTTLTVWAFSYIPQKFQKTVVILFVFLIFLFNKDYWHAKGFIYLPEKYFTSIYNGTTDTGESAPIWSIRFMEHTYKKPLEIIDGSGTVQTKQRNFTDHIYTVKSEEKLRLRENTLYFPGWNVWVDGKEVPVEYQDPANRGLITFFVDKGEHQIEVKFTETKLRYLADFISLVSIIILIGIGVKKKI